MCGVREWQYDMEKGTVLSVFGLAGGGCGVEGKHCVVVFDAIVHEAFDSRVQKLVGSVQMGCSGIIETTVWCATRGRVVV